MSLVTLFFSSLFYTQASNFVLGNHSTWTLIQIIGYSRLAIQKIPTKLVTLENKTLEGL